MESYDAYNIILDRNNNKKDEEEFNIMKKYDIFNDENLIPDDDNSEVHEKFKEQMNNFNSVNDEKNSLKPKNNVRIRPIHNSGIKNLKFQTSKLAKNNDIVDADDFKNFLNTKKQQASGQMSFDNAEHL